MPPESENRTKYSSFYESQNVRYNTAGDSFNWYLVSMAWAQVSIVNNNAGNSSASFGGSTSMCGSAGLSSCGGSGSSSCGGGGGSSSCGGGGGC